MISKDRYQEISKIIKKANEFLEEEQIPDFSILGVVWDDDDCQWLVMFYSDYGNEFINVWVTENGKGIYRLAGHSFEEIKIDI